MARILVVGRLRSSGPGTWTLLRLSRSQSVRLGARGKVRVQGRLEGVSFETTAVPLGEGRHALLITRPIQTAADVRPGDRVTATFQPLERSRPVVLPSELRTALSGAPRVRATFRALAPSHRRAWAEYVAEGRHPSTRQRRARAAVRRIRANQKNPRGDRLPDS